MKNKTLFITNLIVSLVIIIGFFSITLMNRHSQLKLITTHIENISKLTSMNLHTQILDTFSESIHVSQTMSNDSFLKEWLQEEQDGLSSQQLKKITTYLNTYKTTKNYNTAFLVSKASSTYYYYDGINKVVSPQNTHDAWYYNFLRSDEPYCLDIDYDEVNAGHVTLFINCKVVNDSNEVLGVVGIGFQIDEIQELLRKYESDYNLKAYLVDKDGNIMLESNENAITPQHQFQKLSDTSIITDLLRQDSLNTIHWHNEDHISNCIITQYINDFNWYLVIEKNNKAIVTELNNQLKKSTLIVAIIIGFIVLIVSYVINSYNKLILKIAHTDKLTNLQNREAFYSWFEKNRSKKSFSNSIFFMFDVDDFKSVNDTYGHQCGNDVLACIAHKASEYFEDKGMIARWGGDEFVGLLKEGTNAENLMTQFMTDIKEASIPSNNPLKLSISIGMVKVKKGEILKELIKRTDKALYTAKDNGKGQFYFDIQ